MSLSTICKQNLETQFTFPKSQPVFVKLPHGKSHDVRGIYSKTNKIKSQCLSQKRFFCLFLGIQNLLIQTTTKHAYS